MRQSFSSTARFSRSIFFLLALGTASVAFTATASADNGRHARAGRLTTEFKFLEVKEQGQQVVIDYKIRKGSWKALRQAGIKPKLNLHAPNRSGRYTFRYSVKLQDRKGQIRYNRRDLRLRGAKTVELSLVGFSGPNMVEKIALGRDCDRKLRLPIQSRRRVKVIVAEPRPVRPVRGYKAQVIKECRAATRFDSDFNACYKRAMSLGRAEAPQIVRACNGATRFGSDLQACIQTAGRITLEPARVTSECGRATKHSSDLQACMKATTAYTRRSATPVVAACAEHTRFGSELSSCIKKSRAIRGRRAQVVAACGESTRYNSAFQDCLESSRGGVRRASF